MYIGRVAHPGNTYNIQERFFMQGFFNVKVTPMGANLVLLSSDPEDEVEALVTDAKDLLSDWFDEVRPWTMDDVDNERLT